MFCKIFNALVNDNFVKSHFRPEIIILSLSASLKINLVEGYGKQTILSFFPDISGLGMSDFLDNKNEQKIKSNVMVSGDES